MKVFIYFLTLKKQTQKKQIGKSSASVSGLPAKVPLGQKGSFAYFHTLDAGRFLFWTKKLS